MNDKFQVGDLVIAPRLWKGELPIRQIVTHNQFPIRVVNNEDSQYSFMADGRQDSCDLEPSLFHAGTKITIEEAQPKRWPWVNVYQRNGTTFCGIAYTTKKQAMENHYYDSGSYYLHTCQLKPEE